VIICNSYYRMWVKMHIFVERSKIVWSDRLNNVLGKYFVCDGLMDEVPIQPVVIIIIIEEDNVGPKTDPWGTRA
jgi:hypothetical protein